MKLYFFTYKDEDCRTVPVVETSKTEIGKRRHALQVAYNQWSHDRSMKIASGQKDYGQKPCQKDSISTIREREFSLDKKGVLEAFANGLETGGYACQ